MVITMMYSLFFVLLHHLIVCKDKMHEKGDKKDYSVMLGVVFLCSFVILQWTVTVLSTPPPPTINQNHL